PAAARLGKTVQDLAFDLDTALHGVIASSIRRPERPIGVRVRYPNAVRFDPARIIGLPLAVGAAGVVPISAIAVPERAGAQTELVRENLRPVAIVTADREDRDLGSVMRDVRARLQAVHMPEGYRIELGG